MRVPGLVAIVALVLVPTAASAGRSDFGWLYGADVLPERGVELQTWVYEQNGRPGAPSETSLWWGPEIGVTDQLEIALPIEGSWREVAAPSFTLTTFGVEARYRFVSQDPVDAPAFAPLARLAIKRNIGERDAIIVEGDLVGAYKAGTVHAAFDAGFVGNFASGGHDLELHPAAGVSALVVGDLRLGGEAFAELQISGTDSWAAIGPDLAWTHGRFWVSAAYGIGVYHIRTAPRVMWGVAF
jgi:hypothetical protein